MLSKMYSTAGTMLRTGEKKSESPALLTDLYGKYFEHTVWKTFLKVEHT